ncbi:MAG: RnfH family protein [Burkholderiales bacterium]|nr:RnfH family protein [Burkholderiales bacterium]
MRVEVVWALAERQDLVTLELEPGATAAEALAASGLLERHGLRAASVALGRAGVRISPESVLADGDRVEILRPLAADPAAARRRRARRR